MRDFRTYLDKLIISSIYQVKEKNFSNLNNLCLMEKKCTVCNSLFECADSDDCWCISYPKLSKKQLDEEKNCFCKNCLLKLYQKKLNLSE